MRVFMFPAQDVRAGGRQSSSSYQFTLWDPDLDELLRLVPRVVAKVQSLPELVDVTTDREQNGLQANVVIDRAGGLAARRAHPGHRQRAQQRVLAAADFHDLFRAQPVSRHPRGRSAVPARSVRSDPGLCRRRRAARRCRCPASRAIEKTLAPLVINHQGQFPAVTITYNLAPDVTDRGGVARDRAGGGRAASAGHAAHRIRRRRQGVSALGRRAAAGDPRGAAGDLHHPRRAVREPGASADHHLDLPSAGLGALLALQIVQRRADRDRLHRHHPADRHRQEERHHDGGLRARRRAAGRACRRRRRSARRAWRASARS